jgi:DNA-binding transcriptional ArsR family regulator
VTQPHQEGEDLLALLGALANPVRLRIVAALAGGSTYVSQLARDLGISRPLLHMHLQKLEQAGVVVGHLEVSEDGRALRYYAVTDFSVVLDATTVTQAAATLPHDRLRGKNQ